MQRIYLKNRWITISAACVIMLLNIILGINETAMAQGVANVTVTGIPSVISSPFTDQFEQNFRSGRYQVIFRYNNTNTQPVQFRFQFSLMKDGRKELDITSGLKSFSPGVYVFRSVFDELPFDESLEDVLDQIGRKQAEQIIQSGVIPEGNYILNIRAIPEDPSAMISSTPSVNPFNVLYPDAPILINPPNGANLTMETPIFNWVPVSVAGFPIDYHFLLVEVLNAQTPLQAINSNRAHAEATLTGRNTLVYTPEYLPLEPGKEYAWRVKASSVSGDLPIKNEGESPVQTFVYKAGAGAETIAEVRELEELKLIPNFATLTDLDRIDVDEGPNYYSLNGTASLELAFTTGGTQRMDVQVNGIRIQKGSIDAPILMGGSLRGRGETLGNILSEDSKMMAIQEVGWRVGEGVTAGIELRSPDGNRLKTSGKLRLSNHGAGGTVKATGNPLFTYNDELIEVEVEALEATFPGAAIRADGSVKILGEDTGCDLTRFNLIDGQFFTSFRCNAPMAIPLVENSSRINMVVERLSGDLNIGAETGDLEYDFSLRSSVGLDTEQGQVCGAQATVNLSSESGLEIDDVTQNENCKFVQPKIDLGFFALELHKTHLERLAYNSNNGEWDFEVTLGAKFEIPSFGEWGSQQVRDVTITKEGAHFGNIDFSEGLAQLPNFDINNYNVRLETLEIAEFLFPIFTWNQTGPGPWDLSFAGNVTVPNQSNYPECVRGQRLAFTGGKVAGDEVFAGIRLPDFGGCSLELGSGYAFNIDEMGGKIGVKFLESGEQKPIGRLDFDGSLKLGEPFTCDGDPSVQLPQSRLSFTTGIVGEIENIIPACDVSVGPFTAQVNSSSLTFSHEPATGQQASMAASANLNLPEGQTASGSFDLDLMSGRFNSLSFLIEDPFEWNIPAENPVLSFRLNKAEFTEEGFSVDGRQQFLLPSDRVMGATFDSLLIDVETLQIKRGRILFDEEFAFTAGIDQSDQSLSFQAVESDAELLQDPGLYMGMSGQLQIDSEGLGVEGEADASVKFNGETYDLAKVEYSDGFRFRLFPFGVGSGQADIIYNDTRVGWVDAEGFHPAPGFFADLLLPEHLPLPTLDIAYLTLREEGELLVEAVETEDGNYALSTLPGKSLTLTVPALNPDGSAPSATATLDNVVISGNPTQPEIIEGKVEVTVPENNPVWQLQDRGLPLTLKKIEFGSRPIDGTQITALHLLGDLHLFETDVSDAQQEFGFYIESSGIIQGNFDITGMDARIPLLPEDKASLKVEGISGLFSLVEGSVNPSYELIIDSGFELDTETGISTGAEFDLRLTPGKVDLQNFVGEELTGMPEFDFGVFGLKLKELTSIPEFNYSSEQGFNFAFALDADIRIQPEGSGEITFPLQGFEIRHDGIHLPTQNISSASIPGLELPEFEIAGFTFKPISFETVSPLTFNWGEGIAFNPDVNMSFEVDLPDFEGTGLNPPDGLTFNNVGLSDGFLTGSVEPFNPLGGVEIDLVPGLPDSPTLMISSLFGSLGKGESDDGDFQLVDINLEGMLGNIPALTIEDPSLCTENGSFTLSLVESKYFEGTVSGFEPCGYLELGPAKIEVASAELRFSVSEDEQMAELDGGVQVTLPAPAQGTPVVANGSLVLDLINGKINDGSVSINETFALNMPTGSDDPLLSFGVNRAVLSSSGLLINGGGSLQTETVQSAVQFNDLLIGFKPFGVASGNASISTNFGMEVGIQPLSLKLKEAGTAMTLDNGIDLTLNNDISLNNNGLTLSGTSTASLRFQGEEYASLEVAYEDGFSLNVGGFAVNEGRALFYEVEDGVRSQNPLAILDENGFDLGATIIAALPARIPLPSEDVAYIDIKDADDNLLVDVSANEGTGGYTISTTGTPIPVVIAAIQDQTGSPVEAGVQFSLTTDGTYSVTGGSLTLESDVSMRPILDLPVSITEFSIGENGNGLELQAGLKVELPGPLSEHPAIAHAVINSNGFAQGSVSVGNHRTAYESEIEALYTFSQSGKVEDSDETDIFEAALWGVEAEFGAANSIAFSGTLNSSLILEVSGGADPVFFAASWGDTGWDFNVDPGSLGDLKIGDAALALNDENGIRIVSDNSSFYLAMNGVISMDDVIGEPLDVTIQDLEVGVADYDTDPKLHFALGSAAGTLEDQTFTLFDGALEGLIEEPTITIHGRSVALSSASGMLTFLEKNIDYTDLVIDTRGGVTFDNIEANNIELIPGYVVMNTLTLSGSEGLRLDSEVAVTLPAPIDQTSSSIISIYRDEDNQVQVEATAPAFDLEQEYALGDFGHFELTKLAADIDPYDWEKSGIYASGDLYKNGKEESVISFGNSRNVTSNPGIGISATSPYVQFNATGNVQFTYDFSVFEVTVGFDQIAADTEGFEITLNGTLGIGGIDGMSAGSEIKYENFVINQDGVKNTGNLDGSGELTLDGIGTITIGKFFYEKYKDGTDVTIVDAAGKKPDELDGDQEGVPTRVESGVLELLCFGPCPVSGASESDVALNISINAGTDGESGGISGGVETIFFMKKASGEFELLIEGLNAGLMDNFEITAGMHYINSEDGFLLRAAASGEFNFGGQEVSAAVAGKFANIGGETSYGLFVAAKSSVGIPIVPGIVDLTGAGGGFFWKPEQADLDMVRAAVEGMGHDIVSAGKFKSPDDLTFAAQLYASLGIAGSANQYVIEGSTFLEITNKSFYMDVNGVLLGMDGSSNSPGKTMVSGAMSFMVQTDPTFISGEVRVDAEIPAVLTGTGSIEYFSAKNEGKTVWGIIGNADYSIYAGVLNGGGEFLAANEGVLLEVSVGFGIDVPVIEVKSNVTGSIWMIDDPDFSMPVGAYVVFNGKACLGVCISAEAKAAFVKHRSAGYELYGAVKGCVDLLFTDACVSAWVSVTENDFTGGFGEGDHNNLIAQAREQRDQFRAKIQAMMDGIDAAKNALSEPPVFEGPSYSAEDVIKAGANLYALDFQQRRDISSMIENGIEPPLPYATKELPSSLKSVLKNQLEQPRVYMLVDFLSFRGRAKSSLEEAIANARAISDAVSNKLSSSVEKSIEFNNDAETAFDDMLSSMSQSPVSNVIKPAVSENATQSTSFEVDEAMAESQSTSVESLREEIDKLDQQFRESIAQVEENLNEMQSMLAAEFKANRNVREGSVQLLENQASVSGSNSKGVQNVDPPIVQVIPSVNTLATAYMDVHQKLDRYFALEANLRWMNWYWALNLRSEFQDNQSSIQSGISTLNQRFNSALSNRGNPMEGKFAYQAEVFKLTQRNHAILRFSKANFEPNFPYPGGNQAPAVVRDFFNQMSNPNCEGSGLGCIRSGAAQVNEDFWYNMHVEGLKEEAEKSAQLVMDDVIPRRNSVEASVKSAHKSITQILDQFYSNKAALTSILHNMVDNYLNWKQQIELETEGGSEGLAGAGGSEYRTKLQHLAEDLMPPQITGITADPERFSAEINNIKLDNFYNTTEITWTANHGVGVIENSIQIEQGDLMNDQDILGTSIAMGSDEYLSLGENTSFTVYPFKESYIESGAIDETKLINVGLRVRGNAGNTATRRASFYVDVGPDGFAFNKDGGILGLGDDDTSVLKVDTSPPHNPVIKLGDIYPSTTSRDFGARRRAISRTYWTNKPENLTLKIQGYDPESDIASYEYAIGTTKGGTDVIDWTELQGSREFIPEIPTSQITGQTRLMNMQEGVSYYVSVRVTNGEGMVSNVKESNWPVKLDMQKPTQPGMVYVAAPLTAEVLLLGYSTPVDPVAEEIPYLSVSQADRDAWGDAITPEVSASWSKSTDQGSSGLKGYEYVVSSSERVSATDFEGDKVTFTRNLTMDYTGDESGSLLQDYDSEVYVHVRSIDYAGNGSDIYTIGPLQPADPTFPKGGRMQVKINTNDVKLYFTELPYDPETDLKGIQYSIGTSPGSSDLRSWLSSDQVDFEWNSIKNNRLSTAMHRLRSKQDPFVTIPKSALPEGVDLYINYRVVNGHGKISGIRATGPFTHDNSIPRAPSLQAGFKLANNTLRINLNNIEDPESGIKKVRYAIYSGKSRFPVKSWKNLHTHSGIKNGKFNLSKTISFTSAQVSSLQDVTKLKVKIIITNGAGMQRTITKQLKSTDVYEVIVNKQNRNRAQVGR